MRAERRANHWSSDRVAQSVAPATNAAFARSRNGTCFAEGFVGGKKASIEGTFRMKFRFRSAMTPLVLFVLVAVAGAGFKWH